VKQSDEVVAIWVLWFRSRWGRRQLGWRAQSECARTGSSWRSHFRGGRISISGKAASRGGTECRRGQARKGTKGLALTSPGRRPRGCA
jgi:hypothetical protein